MVIAKGIIASRLSKLDEIFPAELQIALKTGNFLTSLELAFISKMGVIRVALIPKVAKAWSRLLGLHGLSSFMLKTME